MKQRISISDDAKVRLWFMATCTNCEPVLGIPFTNEDERDTWKDAHSQGTGHFVRRHTEIVITSP